MAKFFAKSVSGVILILGCFSGLGLHAHPVTYKGGTAVIYTSRSMMSVVEGNHSLTSRFAVGGAYQRFELNDRSLLQSASAQVNWLAQRWNKKEWQANLYFTGGAGYFDQSIQREGVLKKIGFQADWESRSYYFALMHNQQDLDGRSLPMTSARIGIAPYHAGYSELQAWLIWQVDQAPDMFENTQHTPMMRFFYKNVLWEIGSSLEGIWWLQLMSHF